MKVKYIIIALLIVVLGLIVSKMLRLEDALRKQRVVEIIVDDESKPLVEDVSPEMLQKIAMSSEFLFIAEGDYFSTYETRITGNTYVSGFEEIFLKGVNLGVALPDKFPSEFAATYEEYLNWMILLGKMNANTIRVYTILPPEFYRALAWYNMNYSNRKLYLLQGVWAKEPPEDDYSNAQYTRDFMKEIKDAIDVIHGMAVIQPARGHADGVFAYDVSDYTIGLILGREWEPYSVTHTNKNDSVDISYGFFIDVLNPTPMEKWLAGVMEFAVRYETQKYRKQRPLSFVNWLPLDPMFHNSEYIESDEIREFDNDLESVDMEKFSATQYFRPGIFASYHVYPYYPDFIFQEKKYTSTLNHLGNIDNYLAYLLDLKKHQQGMPLVIAEYGVPSSRGNSHYTPFGYHQGGYSEKEQADVSVLMTENIHLSGCAGALYFEWIDEWFKNNWLVMDFEQPQERRKKWHNMENPEQNYGIIAMETRKIETDGLPDDWGKLLNKPFIAADYDPAYFYISGFFPEINFKTHNLYIAIDTYDKSLGSFRLPFPYSVLNNGVEFLIEIKDVHNARIMVDHYYDIFTDRAQMIVPQYRSVKNNDGIFVDQYLLANRARTDILGDTFPETRHNRGKLFFGNSRMPQTSNADFFLTPDGFIEMRLTWPLLNVTDPSSRSVLNGDPETGEINYSETRSFRLLFVITSKDYREMKVYPNGQTLTFRWDKWEEPEYKERIKPVYYALGEIFKKLKPLNRKQIHNIPAEHQFTLCNYLYNRDGAVSFAMDGRCYSQFSNVLPLLGKYFLKASFSISDYEIARSGATQYRKMLDREFEKIYKEGHEVNKGEFWTIENNAMRFKNFHPRKKPNPFVLLRNDTTPGIKEVHQMLLNGHGIWLIFLARHVYEPGTREYENLIHLKGYDVSNISTKHFERVLRVCRNSGFWIAPPERIATYIFVRDNSKIFIQKNDKSFFIDVSNILSPELNKYPLTVLYEGPAKTLKVSNNVSPGIYNVRGGKLLINIYPNIRTIVDIVE